MDADQTSRQDLSPKKKRFSIRIAFISIFATYLFLAACSITMDHFVTMIPPSVAGASYVGVESCAECHEEIVNNFEGATHSRLIARGSNALEIGCEACHGAGSIHNESGGEIGTIHNPGAETSTIHNPKRHSETCFQCHLDVKGSFNLAHSHPIDGEVGCSDCHSPHEGPAIAGGGTAFASEDQTCLECHQAQAGPYVFEHEATRDGCTVCHSPHGSTSEKLLKTSNQMLCLQCHFQQQTGPDEILIGGRNHASFVSRGTCWTAGCHESVHGSHVNSSLRY